MKKIAFLLILLMTQGLSQTAFATSTRGSVESFLQMLVFAENAGNPSNTVIVMDDDDTLTQMRCQDQENIRTCQYLGGPAWFAWQQGQVESKKNPRVADDFADLLAVSDLLLSVNDMDYTDPKIPDVLFAASSRGMRLLVETARGLGNVSATERQFGNLSTRIPGYPTLLSLIEARSLEFAPDMASRAGLFAPCPQGTYNDIAYQRGMMYLSGQNKGAILKCMLDAFNALPNVTPIENVVFIDDTAQNVVDVAVAFQSDSKYDVTALHYTRLQAHKHAFTEGKRASRYQAASMRQWRILRDALSRQLQDPALPGR